MRRLSQLMAVGALMLSGIAHAARPVDKSVAEAFDRGRQAMDAGNFATAIEIFRELRDEHNSVGAALNLGDAYEKQSMPLEAKVAYVAAKDLAAKLKDRREAKAEKKIAELDKVLGHMKVSVKAPAPNQQIYIGNRLIEPDDWDTVIDAKAGDLSIRASAPGYQTWTETVKLQPGVRQLHDIPELIPEPQVVKPPDKPPDPQQTEGDGPTPSHHPPGTPSNVPSSIRDQNPSSSSPWPIWLGVTGGVLVAGGLVTGFIAKSQYEDARNLCGGRTTDCPSAALNKRDQAGTTALVANILTGVGVVGVGVAVYAFLASAGDSSSQARSGVHALPAEMGEGLVWWTAF